MQVTRNLLLATAAIAGAASLLAAAPASAGPEILVRLQELRTNATSRDGGIDTFTPSPVSRTAAVEVASNEPASSLSEKSETSPLVDRIGDLRSVTN